MSRQRQLEDALAEAKRELEDALAEAKREQGAWKRATITADDVAKTQQALAEEMRHERDGYYDDAENYRAERDAARAELEECRKERDCVAASLEEAGKAWKHEEETRGKRNGPAGEWVCDECGFRLHSRAIDVAAGRVGVPRVQAIPDCANGCGPLRPVTWEELAGEYRETIDRLSAQISRGLGNAASVRGELRAVPTEEARPCNHMWTGGGPCPSCHPADQTDGAPAIEDICKKCQTWPCICERHDHSTRSWEEPPEPTLGPDEDGAFGDDPDT